MPSQLSNTFAVVPAPRGQLPGILLSFDSDRERGVRFRQLQDRTGLRLVLLLLLPPPPGAAVVPAAAVSFIHVTLLLLLLPWLPLALTGTPKERCCNCGCSRCSCVLQLCVAVLPLQSCYHWLATLGVAVASLAQLQAV